MLKRYAFFNNKIKWMLTYSCWFINVFILYIHFLCISMYLSNVVIMNYMDINSIFSLFPFFLKWEIQWTEWWASVLKMWFSCWTNGIPYLTKMLNNKKRFSWKQKNVYIKRGRNWMIHAFLSFQQKRFQNITLSIKKNGHNPYCLSPTFEIQTFFFNDYSEEMF